MSFVSRFLQTILGDTSRGPGVPPPGVSKATTLAAAIETPGGPEWLDLRESGQSLGDFAEILPSLSRLEWLAVRQQSWDRLPEELGQCSGLRSIVVLNCPIQVFPTMLARLPALSELVVRGTEIQELPPAIGELQALEYLDYSNNPTPSVPEEIGSLQRLRFLQLADLGLTSLPSSIEALSNLEGLALAGNRFTHSIADEIRGRFDRPIVTVHGYSEAELASLDR